MSQSLRLLQWVRSLPIRPHEIDSSIFPVAPLGDIHCNTVVHILSALGTVTTCLGTFLFLVRARSVFFEWRIVQYGFTVLWLLAIAAVISTAPFSFSGVGVEPRGLCAVSRVGQIEAVGSISVAIFDTVVFTSISLRVISLDGLRRMERRAILKAFLFAPNVGPVCKALLRTGQLYFL